MNVGSVFRPTFCLRASLRCRSVSSGDGGAERRDVLVLHLVRLLCQFIVVEQRRCIVEGLKPQTGYESGCWSYSEWQGQSAQGHYSKDREQRTSPPPGPSERPAGPALSEKRK